MKALSIYPEPVMEIFMGDKTIEYRSWQTDYRGDLLICAGSKKEPGFVNGYGVYVHDGIYRAQRTLLPRFDLRQRGAALQIFDLNRGSSALNGLNQLCPKAKLPSVRDRRDHPFADLEPVDVLDLLRHLSHTHPTRVHRYDLSLDLAGILLVLRHYLRFEVAVPILRHLD